MKWLVYNFQKHCEIMYVKETKESRLKETEDITETTITVPNWDNLNST